MPNSPQAFGETEFGDSYFGETDGSNSTGNGTLINPTVHPYGVITWARQFFAQIGDNVYQHIVDDDSHVMILLMTTQTRNLTEQFIARPITMGEYGDPFK